MSPAPPLRAGLIGCGDISASHLQAYASMGICVAALCDPDLGRAERRRDAFALGDVPIYADHRELLARADVDFVTVATPVALHAGMTIDALRAGKHVACEKPSTLSIAENQAIVAEAAKSNRRAIFFSSRFRYGPASLARHFINQGRVGEIYRTHVHYIRRRGRPGIDIIKDARWFIDSKLSGGGVVMDMGQYFMDMVLDLIGWPTIQSASATTFRGFPHDLPAGVTYDVEEHCTILARAGSRLTCTFDLAWISNHPDTRTILILGTKGAIRLVGEEFHFHSEEGGPWRFIDSKAAWSDKTSHNDHVYRDFIAAIAGHDPGVGTTPTQALAITELTQMALRSAEAGREISRKEITGT